jgi:hypothetical protein
MCVELKTLLGDHMIFIGKTCPKLIQFLTSNNQNSRETGNIGYTRRNTPIHNTMCVGHHYAQINTHNVSKTWALLQTTRGNDEPNKLDKREIIVTSHVNWKSKIRQGHLCVRKENFGFNNNYIV